MAPIWAGPGLLNKGIIHVFFSTNPYRVEHKTVEADEGRCFGARI